jgi:hypothetical protein
MVCEGDIINSAKKMRASGLSYEKVKVFSDGKYAEEEAVKYNNFKWTCCISLFFSITLIIN